MVRRRLNSQGHPLGESRKNCTIPDSMVIRIRNLREVNGLTVAEISRLVGIPEGTVKSLCLYRRRTNVYDEEGYQEEGRR